MVIIHDVNLYNDFALLLLLILLVWQTEGWSNIGDQGGVPVWAADSLAFKATGSRYKVSTFYRNPPDQKRAISYWQMRVL